MRASGSLRRALSAHQNAECLISADFVCGTGCHRASAKPTKNSLERLCLGIEGSNLGIYPIEHVNDPRLYLAGWNRELDLQELFWVKALAPLDCSAYAVLHLGP